MLIILMLCSAAVGAIISYLGVITTYYNMPENTTFLIVEDVVFPISNSTYFNVTVLNPSNSALDINITAIRMSVEGTTEVVDVTNTEPALFALGRGTRQTFKCKRNWSAFAGENVRIEPIAAGASIESRTYAIPNVKLHITPVFNPLISVEYFNVTIENPAASSINLTISYIDLLGIPLTTKATPSLPYVLPSNKTEIFRCDYDWATLRGLNATVTVKTLEGYEAVYTTDVLLGALLTIQEVKFGHVNTTYFNVTIKSSEDSTATATISRINLTLQEGNVIVINDTTPQIGSPSELNSVLMNTSKTFTCFWDWTTYRDKNVTVNVYTNEGFVIANKTVQTPPTVIWNVTGIQFDLDYTNRFSVNVTNARGSLYNITVTQILLNKTSASLNQTALQPGEESVITCVFDWKNFIVKNVTVSVIREDGSNINRTISIPSVGLKILGDNFVYGLSFDPYLNIPIPYFNITISNSNNSLINITINKIVLVISNITYEIDNYLTNPEIGTSGHLLNIGDTITITCVWDWVAYPPSYPINITVYTKEGFQASTFQSP
jgi:hypothetical protein